MSLNPFSKLLLASILSFAISCQVPQSSSEDPSSNSRPNIIYILTDDLGYGDLSCFNPNGKIQTPHIDDIARQGMIFTDAHTTSSVCTPSRYSILTGRYSWRTRLKEGVLTGKSKALVPNSRRTLASMLSSHGYHTAFLGKWHLGWDWALKDSSEFGGSGWSESDFDNLDFTRNVTNTPNDLGFDLAYGHSGSLDMAPYVYVQNGEITALPDRVTVDTGQYTWWRQGPTGSDFVHEDVTPGLFRRSMAYIQARAGTAEPFFLYLALPSPHTPILPSDKWVGKSGLNYYGDFVMMIDDYIGQLHQTLIQAGIEDETMIIFTSDNGCSPEANFELLDSLGHHPSHIYRGHKADIYEGGHRVPFIVKWPGKIAPRSINNNTISTTDFYATCAAMLGYSMEPDEGEDSFNMLSLLTSSSKTTFDRVSTVHHSINGSFAIRRGKWKLIMCPGSGGWSYPTPKDINQMDTFIPAQLYDLEADPGEKSNVYELHPGVVEDLGQELISIIDNGRSTVGPVQENDYYSGEWHQREFSFLK